MIALNPNNSGLSFYNKIKIYAFSILSLFIINESNAQNLVPNPSFELYDTCPNNISQFSNANDWYNCGGTPDFFNACSSVSSGISVPTNIFGFQCPSSSNCKAYAGFFGKCSWLNCREYIGIRLISPTIINKKYFFSVKVNLANESNCGINNLGVIFSTVTHINNSGLSPSILNFAHIYNTNIIQDTINWEIISGSFIADSAYQYLLFGHFFDDSNTDSIMINSDNICQAYYYIDDFCVSIDSSYCNFYSLNCGSSVSEYKTDKYINIIPNPAHLFVNINITNDHIFYYQCNIINIYGEIVKQLINPTKVDVSNLPNGIYLIQIIDHDVISQKKILINH